MPKVTVEQLGNTTAWGDDMTPAQLNDFFFLLDNVQNAEAILSNAVRLLGMCKGQPRPEGGPKSMGQGSIVTK